MARVLFVRHGRSKSNDEGVFAGGKDDTPLVDEGRHQAKLIGIELADKKIDRIVASPLNRTLETAKIISQCIGFDEAKIIADIRFQEYDLGEGQGEPVAGMTAQRMVSFPGAEDPYIFAKRVKDGLKDIVKLEGTTLIVAHGGVGRMIECLRIEKDSAEFFDLPGYPNAHAFELDLSWLK